MLSLFKRFQVLKIAFTVTNIKHTRQLTATCYPCSGNVK